MLEVVAAADAGRWPGGRRRAGCAIGARAYWQEAARRAVALVPLCIRAGGSTSGRKVRSATQPSRVQVGRGASGGGARAAGRPWRKADTYRHSSNRVDTYQRKYRIFSAIIFFPILNGYVSVAYPKRIRIGYVSNTRYVAYLTYPCNVGYHLST